MEVGVSLAVDVRYLVDGGPGDANLEILPVRSVETAQEDLMRFALAAVLRDKDAGDDAQEIARGAGRSGGEHVPLFDDLGSAARRAFAAYGDGQRGFVPCLRRLACLRGELLL